VLLGWSENFHDTSKLLLFVLPRKYRISGIQLCQDAPQTPHVDWHSIRRTENDLRGSIKSRLDVSIYLLILEAARAEIDDLDLGMHGMSEQYIFRFEIAMYDFVAMEEH